MKRNNLSEEDAVKRLSAQRSNSDYVLGANVVLCTLWHPNYTQKQVERAWNQLNEFLKDRQNMRLVWKLDILSTVLLNPGYNSFFFHQNYTYYFLKSHRTIKIMKPNKPHLNILSIFPDYCLMFLCLISLFICQSLNLKCHLSFLYTVLFSQLNEKLLLAFK